MGRGEVRWHAVRFGRIGWDEPDTSLHHQCMPPQATQLNSISPPPPRTTTLASAPGSSPVHPVLPHSAPPCRSSHSFLRTSLHSFERGELREALRSAEDLQLSEAELDELIEEHGRKEGNVLSHEVLRDVLTSGRYRRAEDGRFFVLLSLAEAETIRMIMHLRQGKALVEGSDVALALRCLPAHDAVFDQSENFTPSPKYQASVTLFR